MDYLKIVLDGYLSSSTNKNMTEYFFKSFKKGEKEYIGPKMFFELGCLGIVEAFKTDIKNRLFEERNRVFKMINAAKAETIKYLELTEEQTNNAKLVRKKEKNLLNYCNDRLSELSETSFSAFLTEITNGRYLGSLSWESIEYIEYSILTAYKRVIEESLGKDKHQIKKGKVLTLDQIALKLVYEGQTVTQENAKTIISKYGWTSGDKLYKKFIFYYKTSNRISYPYPRSLQKLKNKIDLFESVIKYLPLDKQDKAYDELKILQNLYNVEDH